MKDLSTQSNLSQINKEIRFLNKVTCFMNLEVIYPTSVNVIPYDCPLLVFHGTMEYNDEGVGNW